MHAQVLIVSHNEGGSQRVCYSVNCVGDSGKEQPGAMLSKVKNTQTVQLILHLLHYIIQCVVCACVFEHVAKARV